ncbi:methylated-DNA--[protein]-cysteine S-methyltransferase [Sphaerisporangium rubeum]|uniref:methylated-DNA--[protein]-cysteine S-methyltransferase n=1 Tax=Sphaerisporangium rubeum TaxID=321317 RepID=A0A7X0M9J2_9ACTN|nr:methylated-DNA--[protein]-cysteine S-methyltransferase [Sphaerisporangium rubeum]MBB6475114.1 methylated-DNA-[protein]-cysteine S-methyltransferase [Sphaerisporangium rubeum]
MTGVAFGTVETPLGDFLVAVTGDGVAATAFHDGDAVRRAIVARLRLPETADATPARQARDELAGYFAGERRVFDVPIDWRLMSPLQRKVLGTLTATVGYGQVTTYGALAESSAAGVPARAIGSVMGSNPIPVIVPCHRVVAGNGLGGFSGGEGVEDKRWLLTLEGYLQPTLDWAL